MQRDELAAWLRLTLTPGLGNAGARKLLRAFGLPQQVFEQPLSALRQVLTSAQSSAAHTQPEGFSAQLETTWQWLQSSMGDGLQRRVSVLGDAHYPSALLNLDDPPVLLYLLGNASFTQPGAQPTHLALNAAASLAVVGSRNPTPQGLINARQFSKAMVQAGLTVVSGLALGIDGAAHEGALAGRCEDGAQGATVAVVGTGLDRVYPRAHRQLAHDIALHGLLLSEYPLGTPPLTANFPKRNRLITGLSQGTLVVEAALKSGSLISARLCNEQGKEVFAIPGSIHAAQSRGCHALIKQGAKLVESAQDILEDMRWVLPVRESSLAQAAFQTVPASPPLEDEQTLLVALGYDPVSLDALQARTSLSTAALQSGLMTLEIGGLVARLPGGLFQRQVG